MTEDEKTIEAMKSARKSEAGIQKPKETPKEMTQPNALGVVRVGNTDVTLSPWNGKTKKKTKKVFEFVERLQDVDFQAVLEVLIYDQVTEDLLFDEYETKLILLKLKELSIGSTVNFDVECEKCGSLVHIKTDTSKYSYTPAKLPHKFSDKINFVVPKKSTYDANVVEITNAEDYDGITTNEDIELSSRIEIEEKDITGVINYLDDAPLKDVSELISELKDCYAKFEMEVDYVCDACKSKGTTEVDIMTGIFEELVK